LPFNKRIVVTGMSVNTPLGDTLDDFLNNLLAGKSAITKWKGIDTSRVYAKIGGDLSEYDIVGKVKSYEGRIPADMYRRLRRLTSRIPFSAKLAMPLALDAFIDAGLLGALASTHKEEKIPVAVGAESNGVAKLNGAASLSHGVIAPGPLDQDFVFDPTRIAGIIPGHNFNSNYSAWNGEQFAEEPDYIDPLGAVHGLDTNHAGCVSELLGIKGPTYTIGGACASANLGLRAACDEILYHDMDMAFVVGPLQDFSSLELHAMALLGAITFHSYNDTPEIASRPFDTKREGFVPSHGGAALVLETLEHAQRRGAKIYAELLAIDANSDASHLPQPSEEGQTRLSQRVLKAANLAPEQIDFVSTHATSTPLGDIIEARSIQSVFGAHARNGLKINAPKSMLGHTCWAAPAVETVAAILQMNAGKLHPSTNIDEIDPEIDLDVCANTAVDHEVNYFMKNSFGFGGINSIAVWKKWESA
jgi:3-oxoacyl-(acyl-carrier-protein) synthase